MSAATRTIRVDGDVFVELQRLAKQHGMGFSSPNAVLRRALSIGDSGARAPRKLWAVVEVCFEDLKDAGDVGLSLHGSRETAEWSIVAQAQTDFDGQSSDDVDGFKRPETFEAACEFMGYGGAGDAGEIDVREIEVQP